VFEGGIGSEMGRWGGGGEGNLEMARWSETVAVGGERVLRRSDDEDDDEDAVKGC
jgi:hypothetical protein